MEQKIGEEGKKEDYFTEYSGIRLSDIFFLFCCAGIFIYGFLFHFFGYFQFFPKKEDVLFIFWICFCFYLVWEEVGDIFFYRKDSRSESVFFYFMPFIGGIFLAPLFFMLNRYIVENNPTMLHLNLVKWELAGSVFLLFGHLCFSMRRRTNLYLLFALDFLVLCYFFLTGGKKSLEVMLLFLPVFWLSVLGGYKPKIGKRLLCLLTGIHLFLLGITFLFGRDLDVFYNELAGMYLKK